MKRQIIISILIFISAVTCIGTMAAEADSVAAGTVEVEAYVTAGAATGTFAPHYISALEHGRYSQAATAQTGARIELPVSNAGRFSYGFGAEGVVQATSAADYERYDVTSGQWFTHSVRPESAWIHQLYASARYRSLWLTAGMKEHSSFLHNSRLGSGDLIESGNARPLPEIRGGLNGFQNIPYTQGWIQIHCELAYGKFMDDSSWRSRYNYYNYHIARNVLFNYKHCYFRTNPSAPLSVIAGMQAVAMFGGITDRYKKGKIYDVIRHEVTPLTFFKVFLPIQDGGDGFYTGNHIGSWDFRARYRLRSGAELTGYFAWPFEDGSGIGKLNGWDGVWGLEYKAACPDAPVSGAVVEYLDFVNQSGPTHFAPADYPGTDVNTWASGADDYYNNVGYNSYAYFGHAIGTPALMAPLYNLDGYPAFTANRMRGFHIGVEGRLHPSLTYRVKGGYREAYGSGYISLPATMRLAAVMLEADWTPALVKNLRVNARVELDRGDMPENSLGAMLSLRYCGNFNLKRK